MTGQPNFGAGQTQKWPSYGSVVSGFHGTNAPNGLPTYIKMNSIQHDDSSFMGGKFVGYDATKEGRKDLQLNISDKTFQGRLNYLKLIDEGFTKEGDLLSKQWSDLKGQAVEVIAGEASKAFKIEGDMEYDKYKGDPLGEDMLTSMRLVEAGSQFVTLNYGGWDMHSGIANSLSSRQPTLDTYLSYLIESLTERGLSERVMLVVTSEFARTPKINTSSGRDHWPNTGTLMISCDKYETGRVIGGTDKRGEEAIDKVCGPRDLRWTMFNHLGLDKSMKWTGLDGRPYHMIETEAKNVLTEL